MRNKPSQLLRTPHSALRTLRGLTIGIIGAGSMGQALINGLRDAGMPSGRLLVVESDPRTTRRVRAQYRVVTTTMERLAERCDVVLVAVKPQDLPAALETLSHDLRGSGRRVLVISIAAGVKLAALERLLGRVAVVRVMPNLPAKVGCAISAMAAGRFATASHRAVAAAIFRCVGEVVELPERCFDAVTAVSGSGPAYFFTIFQALRDAGVQEGLPKSIATRLAVRTGLGSARLVETANAELEMLISQVASKRGTTEAALKVFRRRRLPQIIHAGVAAAARRSRALST